MYSKQVLHELHVKSYPLELNQGCDPEKIQPN